MRRARPSIKRRITSPSDGLPEICVIPGCGRATMRSAGKGLAVFHCRKHVEHKARHGSHWHGTYRAADLKPYIAASASYVATRKSWNRPIALSLDSLQLVLLEAGPTELETRLIGMPAHRRAKIAIARLREEGVQPDRILSIVFAVTALIEEDPGSHRTSEFRIVQISKVIHRLASGTHKFWDVHDAEGRPRRIEMHAFPKSTGPVLRLMGRLLEEPCEVVVREHLQAMLALKIKRFGRHPQSA